MPTEQRIGLDDQEGLFPVGDTTSEGQEPEAVALVEVRSFDLTLKNQELMTQESIFSEELRATEWQIAKSSDEQGAAGRVGQGTEELIREGEQK